jgi:hypothetical protein
VNSTATEPTDDTPLPESSAAATAYDRDLLREQMEILRRESVVRAGLEKEIRTEHETVTVKVRTESEQAITAARSRYGGEIEAARREHAALLHKAEAYEKAERKKADDRLKTDSVAVKRRFEQAMRQADEEDSFEESSLTEVHRDKRKDPQRLFVKAGRDASASLAQIGDAEGRIRKQLAGWRVPGAPTPTDEGTEPAAPAEAASEETGDEAIPPAAAAPRPADPLPPDPLPRVAAGTLRRARALRRGGPVRRATGCGHRRPSRSRCAGRAGRQMARARAGPRNPTRPGARRRHGCPVRRAPVPLRDQ